MLRFRGRNGRDNYFDVIKRRIPVTIIVHKYIFN